MPSHCIVNVPSSWYLSSGEEIFVNTNGEVSCQCKYGWSRINISDNPSVTSQGDCVQEYTDYAYNDLEDEEDVVSRVRRAFCNCRGEDYPFPSHCLGNRRCTCRSPTQVCALIEGNCEFIGYECLKEDAISYISDYFG